ncbi:hypothetical protein Bca4012_011426 [Brassica carinata]
MMNFSDLLLLPVLLHMCLNVDILVIFILSILLFLILYVFLGINGSPDVPKKLSSRAGQPLKLAELEPDSSSSPISTNNRTPKDKNPKVSDRKPPRSPLSEKQRPSRITELEALVSQLQEDLKKAKHQVTVSKTSKEQAKQEAEESRKQLQEFSSKLQENQNQFLEVSALEKETDKTCHRSVSQECDLEFGGISDERAGLAAVVKEIRQLKLQIEMVASSESGHVRQAELRNSEIHLLRGNLMDTLFLVESFRNQLKDCEVTDAETEALATETLRQLESAKKAVEELKSDGTKAVESYKKLAVELEQSKSRMVWLEGLVTKLLANPGGLENHETLLGDHESIKIGESNEMKEEVSSLRCEVERLRAALEASGKKDQKGNVEDKETELEIVSDENETLIHKSETDVQDALKKLGTAMEEADKSTKRTVRFADQLDATQASNSEMETELRKLKVQSNQWRKSAEAATAMPSAGNNYNQTNSPYSEEIDDEVTKKKTGNVLKKISVFWKKPQK